MNILIVDNESYVIADHRDALQRAGHTLSWADDLASAVDLLEERPRAAVGAGTARFELVMIDLALSCEIPDALKTAYENLRTGTGNEGQALGQWLWIERGARRRQDGPMHCYFSHLLSFYRLAVNQTDQEFALPRELLNSGQPPDRLHNFLLSKNTVRPSQLPGKLGDVCECWKQFLATNA